jgi:membrane protein DedA with SNARE-associated domain
LELSAHALLVAVEGSVATLVAATLAGAGILNPWLVFVAAGIGNATADAAWYWLGRLGRLNSLATRLPWLRRFEPLIAQLEKNIKASGPRLYVTTKLCMWPAVIPTLIAAGMARVSWRKMILVSAVSETIWSGGLVLVGFFLGSYLSQLRAGFEWLSLGLGVTLILVLPILLKHLTKVNQKGLDHKNPYRRTGVF